jgi:hypothetical protein
MGTTRRTRSSSRSRSRSRTRSRTRNQARATEKLTYDGEIPCVHCLKEYGLCILCFAFPFSLNSLNVTELPLLGPWMMSIDWFSFCCANCIGTFCPLGFSCYPCTVLLCLFFSCRCWPFLNTYYICRAWLPMMLVTWNRACTSPTRAEETWRGESIYIANVESYNKRIHTLNTLFFEWTMIDKQTTIH